MSSPFSILSRRRHLAGLQPKRTNREGTGEKRFFPLSSSPPFSSLGRLLPDCHIVLTSRHEAGRKVRRYCDNLWEIVGFTSRDAENSIYKYFKNMKHLAVKLVETMYDDCHTSADLLELRSNALHLTLLCVLCEDFEGVFPTKQTQLFMEIVRCILRRYEKNDKPSSSKDPLAVYREELIDLGRVALQSLHKGEFCFEEAKLRSTSSVLIKSGVLSIQTGGIRRKSSLRCGFIHRSFQEFFAGFYLAFQIADGGKIDCDSVVNDERYKSELNQVFLFMSGIVALQCEKAAVSFVKSLTTHVNLLGRTSNHEFATKRGLAFAFDFVLECKSHNESIQSELLHTIGRRLELKTLAVYFSYHMYFDILFEALKCNTCLNRLQIGGNYIGASGASSVSEVLKVNTCLTYLGLSWNGIGDSGAAAISEALRVNTCLIHLGLSWNEIGDSGAAAIAEALKVNTCLTDLDLQENEIGDSGAAAISEALEVNTCLTNLNLRRNRISRSVAAAISEACRANQFSKYVFGDFYFFFLMKKIHLIVCEFSICGNC